MGTTFVVSSTSTSSLSDEGCCLSIIFFSLIRSFLMVLACSPASNSAECKSPIFLARYFFKTFISYFRLVILGPKWYNVNWNLWDAFCSLTNWPLNLFHFYGKSFSDHEGFKVRRGSCRQWVRLTCNLTIGYSPYRLIMS